MLVDPSQYLSKDQLNELRRIDPLRSLGSIAWTWGWILGCFALYARWPSVWTVVFSWFVMSGRHLGLAILMHDGAHGLLLRNKVWNDRIGQWLTAYPTLADMLLYRRAHFQHHRHTWTEQDPDLQLATALPVSAASFRRKMIRDLTGQTAFARHVIYVRYAAGLDPRGRGLGGKSLWSALRAFASSQRGFLLAHALLIAFACALGRPDAYLLIWWLPAWTGYSVVLRIRSIAEHACVSDPSDPLRQTRTTLAPAWLRFLIAPHHVNYHLEHHLFMTVPHYNLQKAHRWLREAGVLDNAEVAPSYRTVLRLAIRERSPA
ncbi:MAG TPA: fatty acid desaturase family protein [Polyangiales bacterium]|nr:fatty acid desaturase family protein [Polyangiales bacterium]